MNEKEFSRITGASCNGSSTAVTHAMVTMHRVLVAIGWGSPNSEPARRVEVDFESPLSPVSDVELSIDEMGACLIMCINFRPKASLDVREQALRFITRANWALVVGNFEMDIDNGALRFRSSLVFGDAELGETLVRPLIASAMDIVERHITALMQVLDEGLDTDIAIEAVWRIHDTEVM